MRQTDNLVNFLGLAKRAGCIEIGADSTEKVIQSHRAKLVMTASDAGASAKRQAMISAEKAGIEYIALPFTKAQLGAVLGRGLPGVLALTDAGFASGVLKKLGEVKSDADDSGALSAPKRVRGGEK